MAFTNYQLYRTTPKLSGNMKMDLIVYDSGSKLYIKDFHIRPLSNLIPYNIVDENILVRPHQLNIARFYSKIKGNFYQAKADPQLLSDWPIIASQTELKEEKRKYIKNWDDTYWAGTQRMLYKPYSTTHELLIPVWLESVGDASNLTIEIGLIPDNSSIPVVTKVLSFSNGSNDKYHNNFYDYLNKYFNYIGIAGGSGNNKCLNINLTKNESYIYGLNVEDGNMQTRTDFNITRNLLFRERPLLESNSLLTNVFSDVHLILPQLINFNLCFDINKWIPESMRPIFGQTFYISATVKVNGKALEKRDLYTNHQFVPRPINQDVSDGRQIGEPYNALDYKFDYKCSDLMHKNKITQPICHWMMTENQDILFNLYDGFGASYNGLTINHFFGTVNDPSNIVTDPLIPNTSPFGPKLIGDGDEVNYVLNHAEKFIDDRYFVGLSDGWVNGFRVKYTPKEDSDIKEIFVAGMTTPFDHEFWKHKTSDTQTVTDPAYFAIWTARYDKEGESTLPDMTANDIWEINKANAITEWEEKNKIWSKADKDKFIESWVNLHPVPKTKIEIWEDNKDNAIAEWEQKNPDWTEEDKNDFIESWETEHPKPEPERSEYDEAYDIALYHDMDNRWGFGAGGYNSSHRLEINSYGLYFCVKKIDWPIGQQETKALVVLIWDQQIKRNDGVNDDLVFKSKQSFQNIGFIIEALNRYITYTEAYAINYGIDLNNRDDFKLLQDLKLFDEAISNSTIPGVWYFNNTIFQKQDNKVSQAADEITYYKSPAKDTYVYRSDGQIKPAMYPVRLAKTTDFGMNYFWVKTFYDDKDFNDVYNQYSQTGVTPRYPSIGYECVVNDSEYGEILNPDRVYSRTADLKEYKWFNKSKVVQYPTYLEAEVDSDSADKENDIEVAVKNVIYRKLKDQLAEEIYDKNYVYSLYDINYELLRVKKVQDSSRPEGYKLLYTYRITMKLK